MNHSLFLPTPKCRYPAMSKPLVFEYTSSIISLTRYKASSHPFASPTTYILSRFIFFLKYGCNKKFADVISSRFSSEEGSVIRNVSDVNLPFRILPNTLYFAFLALSPRYRFLYHLIIYHSPIYELIISFKTSTVAAASASSVHCISETLM